MIMIACLGHFFMHIPQPTHNSSEMTGFPSSAIRIVSSPLRTLGQYLMHSSAHLRGWHRSLSSMAILMLITLKEARH